MCRPLAIGGLALLLALPLCAEQPTESQAQNSQAQNSQSQDSQSQDSQAQDSQGQSTSPSKADQQKKDQAKKPSPAANPFPEAQSEKAAQQDTAPQDSSSQGSTSQDSAPQSAAPPDAPAQHTGKSTAQQNPFPEEQSEKAAKQADQPQNAPAAAPGTSAPNAQDSSSSAIKGLNLGDIGPRSSDGSGGTVLSPDLARKDAKVGDFYLQTGDFKGAYDRFVEAAKVDPANAEAVYGLADAARHLNHREEAIRNYQLYLTALPDGPRSKDARKALKEMGVRP